MSLQGHEKATRILATAMQEHGARCGDPEGGVLLALGRAYQDAADKMEEAIRAQASGGRKP